MMNNWNGSWDWSAWFAMGFMMLVFWGLIVAVVLVAIRSWGHRPESPSTGTSSEDDALRVLDTRFARGEIDADEYTSRRELLRKP